MKRWFVGLCLLAGGVPFHTACAPAAAPVDRELVGTASEALEGPPAPLSGQIVALYSERFRTICSGSLLGPNLILTTRHCIDGTPITNECARATFAQAADDDTVIGTSCSDVSQLDKSDCNWQRSVRVFRPVDDNLCGADIALLVTRDVIRTDNHAYMVPEFDPPAVGGTFTISGYGLFGSAGGWGPRRQLDNFRLDCVEGSEDCSSFVQQAVVGDREFVSGKDGVCDGDSGAPGFFSRNGQNYVQGVVSRAATVQPKCQGVILSRVDSWKPLVIEAGLFAAKYGNYVAPTWTKVEAVLPEAGAPDVGVVNPGTCPGPDCGALVGGGGCSVTSVSATRVVSWGALVAPLFALAASWRRRRGRTNPSR